MSLEENIRQMVAEEVAKRLPADEPESISEFCRKRKLSRTTVWRAIKRGELKTSNIGRRVFVIPPRQLTVA